MKYGQWCLAIGGVSVLLISSAHAQSAASCRKAEFRGGAPVFYYDKACMAKLKTNASATDSHKAVKRKTVVKAKSSRKVRVVQKLLTAKGYNSGGTDGLMGPKTRSAIGSYYKKHGLKKGAGSKLDAVYAHLKSNLARKTAGNSTAAKKKARVAAIKKAVAAKRAAAAKKQAAKSGSSGFDQAAANAAAAKKKKDRVAAIKKAVAAKRAAAAKKQAAKSGSSGFDQAAANAAAAAKKKKARVAAIKKAVAAKRAAAAKKQAAKSGSSGFDQAAANAAATKRKNARVAAIKKAVAAKNAAAPKAKRDANIVDLQTLLKNKGAYNGAVDGTMNIETRRSVISYYHAHNVDIGKGTIAQGVHKHLKSGGASTKVATASKVKKDANVADLQTLLKNKGAYNGAVDGTMNIETRRSVINYYHAHDVDIGKGTIAQGVHKHLKSGGSAAKVAVTTKAPAASAKASPSKVDVAAVAAKKRARVAAIKKAVAAKRAAAKKKKVAAVPKVKKDANVADLQALLKKKGAYNGAIDGAMNIETRRSVISYYHAHNVDIGNGTIVQGVHKHLKAGGSTKVATAAKAKVSAPKKAGASKSTRNKVVEIQAMLSEKGLYSGKADGILNAPTRRAIISYYKKKKVKRGDSTIIDSVHKHLTAGSV